MRLWEHHLIFMGLGFLIINSVHHQTFIKYLQWAQARVLGRKNMTRSWTFKGLKSTVMNQLIKQINALTGPYVSA